jgi:hypothetical protein
MQSARISQVVGKRSARAAHGIRHRSFGVSHTGDTLHGQLAAGEWSLAAVSSDPRRRAARLGGTLTVHRDGSVTLELRRADQDCARDCVVRASGATASADFWTLVRPDQTSAGSLRIDGVFRQGDREVAVLVLVLQDRRRGARRWPRGSVTRLVLNAEWSGPGA